MPTLWHRVQLHGCALLRHLCHCRRQSCKQLTASFLVPLHMPQLPASLLCFSNFVGVLDDEWKGKVRLLVAILFLEIELVCFKIQSKSGTFD